jgi:diguanylate cyclase (GGDEF)-like protein
MVPGASPNGPSTRSPAVENADLTVPAALAALGSDLRENAWELAVAAVDQALAEDAIPSLARLGRIAQLGDLPTFISELGREVESPLPGRMRLGGPLAGVARDHARQREALGFAPREIVTEFLLLRRVLWRFVASRIGGLAGQDVLEIERRLNDTVDRLVTECVVAYFDRATAELAEQARRDPLTGLLNHQAFSRLLELELARAARYDHGLTLVFLDLDGFKQINDTYGHLEGDRVLQRIGSLLRTSLRGSDMAGRLGGDEFGVVLLEADKRAGDRFLHRSRRALGELVATGQLPDHFDLSAGFAHYPSEATDASELLRLADARQYEAKRTKHDSRLTDLG